MTHNNVTPPPESPRRPRYLPPEPEKSGWLSKPTKQPAPPEPLNSQHPNEPPALPAFSNSLLSYKGRLGRLSLQAANLALILIITLLIFVLTIIAVVVGIAGNLSSIASNPFSIGLGLFGLIAIPMVLMLLYIIIFQIRRLHDLNHSGWWLLLPFPFSIINMITTYSHIWSSSVISLICSLVGGLFYLYLLLMPGTPSHNRYGAPRYTPTSEKVMGWLYILLLVLLLFASYKMSKTFPISNSHPTVTSLTTASAPTPITSGKYNAPYPLTAQQLWANILKVTALPNGKLIQAQIENAFGTTLHPNPNSDTRITIFETSAGQDRDFSLQLSLYHSLGISPAIFSFKLKDAIGTDGSQPLEGMCINVADIKPSILTQGWIEKTNNPSDSITSNIEYDKGDLAHLIITYNTSSKCLKYINLSAFSSIYN